MANPVAKVQFPETLETYRLLLKRISFNRSGAEVLAISSNLGEGIASSYEELSERFSWVNAMTAHPASTFGSYTNMAQKAASNSCFHFAVYTKAMNGSDEEFVAFVSLEGRELELPAYSIGYWCVTKHAGKGYVSEAVMEMCRFAIEDVKVKRLDLTPERDNKPSRAIATKLMREFGFEYIGLKQNAWRHQKTNVLCHAALYSFTQPD